LNKYRFILILILIGCFQFNAQDTQKKVKSFWLKKDTAGQRELLTKWERAEPNNPEFYASMFNYYVQKSELEAIRRQSLSNKDNLTHSIFNSKYDKSYLKEAFKYIDKGILLFPNRLDMRIGKIYLLGEIKSYTAFCNDILKTIQQSDNNRNVWFSTNNIKQAIAKDFMFTNIQEFIQPLLTSENDSLLNYVKKIAETTLLYYPRHIESMTNLGTVYIAKKAYEKALTYLNRAERFAPNDAAMLKNLAFVHLKKGDKNKAIYYYDLTAKYGDEIDRKMANEKLLLLKKTP
jgi:tetratricopeptide (TPR) repeat protein